MSEVLIEKASPDSIRRAVDRLARGELVGIPTETVYGLAANAGCTDAVQRIYAAKGRPSNNPLIVHVSGAEAALPLVRFDGHDWLRQSWDIGASFWPGPLTLVVPRTDLVIDAVTAGMSTVAIRVPSHRVTRQLLEACSFPLAAPSANVSNYVSPTTAQHVAQGLGNRVSMVIDGGPSESGVESTIVELTPSGPRLLRPGGVSSEALEEAFGSLQIDAKPRNESSVLLAPGMLPKHYSPSKRLIFWDAYSHHPEQRVGRLTFQSLPHDQHTHFHRVWTLSESGDLKEVARNLFAMIREADQSDCDVLVIDRCVEDGIGRAIMNRLHRAVTE